LQALRYAALVSTFRAGTLADVHAQYVAQSEGRQIEPDAAREELEAFIEGGDLDVVDEELKPRIVLVAAGFQSTVTTTVIWLTRAYDMDITCVQLVPYEVGGQVVLGSSILLPLPEAGDYEDRVAEKQRAATNRKATVSPLDHDRARAFIAAIPTGRWAAYIDVAVAGGSPKGAMGVGSWLKSDTDIPHVYRVLNRSGQVNEGYTATEPDLPSDPAAVKELLEMEGVTFTEDGRAIQEQRWTVADGKGGEAG
jgi:alkylated DNA nucleotide flippase Atl1